MEIQNATLASLSVDGRGTYGIGAPAVERSESLFTYLRITDICDDGTLNMCNLKSVNDEKACNYLLKPNDMVFARTGASTGRNYFYDGNDGEFVYAGFLIKFSIDPKKVNPKYVKYYCMSEPYKGWIRSFNTGSTRGNINAHILGEMPIPILPRKQQDGIVHILSVLENKMRKNTEINKNLEQQAIALFDYMFDGVSKGNKTIGEYIVPRRGKSLLSKDAILGEVPVIAGGLEPATYHNQSNTTPPVVTISASGANAGFVNLWNIPVWSSDSSFIDGTMTDNVYFWYVMLKKRQKEIFDAQTGSAQPHIYPQHIANMPIQELDLTKVSEFTEKVKPFSLMIGTNIKENLKLSSTRDALLPRLMSGELDVSELEI